MKGVNGPGWMMFRYYTSEGGEEGTGTIHAYHPPPVVASNTPGDAPAIPSVT